MAADHSKIDKRRRDCPEEMSSDCYFDLSDALRCQDDKSMWAHVSEVPGLTLVETSLGNSVVRKALTVLSQEHKDELIQRINSSIKRGIEELTRKYLDVSNLTREHERSEAIKTAFPSVENWIKVRQGIGKGKIERLEKTKEELFGVPKADEGSSTGGGGAAESDSAPFVG